MLSNVTFVANLPTPHFRLPRNGPELTMQTQIASRIPELFSAQQDLWTGASLPVGAGVPDLVVAAYHPQVLSLANVEISPAQLLAYLRAVGPARLETIADRLRTPKRALGRSLESLVDAEVVTFNDDLFYLSPIWKNILPEIITIEVKVADWQRAIEQAARNRIFAHRSFVALPERIASRICEEPIVSKLGLGLLSVSVEGSVRVSRKARRRQPTIWTYYYKIAALLARSFAN
jgi:hypothetical protein